MLLMLVPPTATAQTRHMKVTPVTAPPQTTTELTFRRDVHRNKKVLSACFSVKHEHI